MLKIYQNWFHVKSDWQINSWTSALWSSNTKKYCSYYTIHFFENTQLHLTKCLNVCAPTYFQDLDTIPLPARPNFFKGTAATPANSSSTPPVPPARDSPKITPGGGIIPPPPPPYKPSVAPRTGALPQLPNFLRASDDSMGQNGAHSTFFQSRGDYTQ